MVCMRGEVPEKMLPGPLVIGQGPAMVEVRRASKSTAPRVRVFLNINYFIFKTRSSNR